MSATKITLFLFRHLALQKLDLMHNDLIELPEDMGSLRKLQCLYAQHNDIRELPNFDGCSDLQELHISNNFIEVCMRDMKQYEIFTQLYKRYKKSKKIKWK